MITLINDIVKGSILIDENFVGIEVISVERNQIELYDAIASATAQQDVYHTYNYDNYINNSIEDNPMPMNFMKLNGYNPLEGVLMATNNIPGMGNAFIVASVYRISK